MANKIRYTQGMLNRAIRGDSGSSFVMPFEKNPGDNVWIDDPRKSSHGHIPTIAKRLECSEQTVRNYCNRKNSDGELTKLATMVRAAIEQEKDAGLVERADFHHDVVTNAEKVLALHIEALDLNATKFALTRLDKGNYSSRSEMTGADGKALFDGETMALLDEMGIDVEEAMRVAAQSIKTKLQAAKNKGHDDTHSNEHGE